MNDSIDREAFIYGEALALPASERAVYLNEACGGNAGLREAVEGLLGVQEKAGTFFEGLERETLPPRMLAMEAPGEWIDRYQLVEQIGEGGCGVVYRAEQEKPVQRQVALKIIKLGMDTRQVVARFEAERQALALMDHPHIARVLDAGATETGRPYFVMELVRGTKITEYCDQYQLSTPERLDLFIQACRAIQHAHQKGVIHRDIKPSNILVTVQDGAAFPKVIDFGIAKATQGRLTNRTVFTGIEQFIGTPAYMSPEQAELGGIDTDTRSDIYSLGVVLYELLTSKTPFDSQELLDLGLDGMRRAIRDKEPARPSARLNALVPEDLSLVAGRRRTEAPKLIASIRGDLDWIVMKALEKERSLRYATVNSLIRDIERHLASEPVTARPPSQLDRFRKLVHRNALVFVAAAAVLTALVLGLSASTWLFFREKEARRQAQVARAEQEQLRLQAEKETQKSRKVTQSLEDVLNRLGSVVASSHDRTELRQILDQLTPADGSRPQNAALLRMRAYLRGNAGDFAGADADLDRLLELTPKDSELWHWRAATLLQTRQFAERREHCQRSLERFKGTTNYLSAERIAKDSLVLPDPGVDLNAVDALVEIALSSGPGHPEVGWFQLTKGMVEYRKGNFDRAAEWLQQVTLGRDTYLDAETLLMVAMAAAQAGHSAEAHAALERASVIMDRDLPKVLNGDINGGWVDWAFSRVLQREANAVVNRSRVEIGDPKQAKD